MKRHWLLFSLALTAAALTLGAITWGSTWATSPPSSSAAGSEESETVPPIVKQTFAEDLRKVAEQSQGAPSTAATLSDAPPVPEVAGALPGQGLVRELVAILNETKSIDTFLVTLRLLEDMGKQAEPAIPAIIRNAERLELFKDHFTRRDGNGELLDDILGSLERIRSKEEKSRGKDPLFARPKDARPMLPPTPPMSAETSRGKMAP
jgi:hypothetical protein